MHARPAEGLPPEEARRQRLLRIVFSVVIGLSLGVMVASRVPGLDVPWNATTAAITGAVGLVYVAGLVVLALGHTRGAATILVAGVLLGTWVPILWPGAISGGRTYTFVGLSVLIASYALSARTGVVVAAANVVGLLGLWYIRDLYVSSQLAEDLLLFGVLTSIVISVAWFNESDRRAIQAGRSELEHALDAQRALMDNSPDAILAVDSDGHLLSANRVAQRWAAERFHVPLTNGMAASALLSTEAAAEWDSLLKEARRCGAVRSEMLWNDERPNWFQIFLHATTTGSVTVQVRDVSDERRLEMEARQAYRDRIELDKLREMDSFRLHLLNTASHELRTPITPLRLQLSLLQRLIEGNEPALHSVQVLNRNVNRLAVLVDDLLDVARIEGGELRLERQRIELDSFLAREMEGYDAVAADRGVQLVFQPGSNATVDADPGRLAQVFTNLLTNALKYTSDGGRIQIKTRRRGSQAVVEVCDDGAGFSPARAPGLFQPFIQLHDGHERRDGTGLGLFICQGILERHGGTIWGRSDGPGRGAQFGFELPARATLKHEAETVVQP